MIEWKTIEEASNYEISNQGEVRNRLTGKILKGRPSKSGYLQVSIKINSTNKFTNKYIHRLVAQYFLPNKDNKPAVNHLDGDKTNNVFSNLEWVTDSENQIHAWKTGLSINKGQRKVGAFNINNEKILEFNSIVDAAKYFNKSRVNIDNALYHKKGQKTAYGYIWKFLD